MPAPPVWMNSSGMDIQGTINKLMELERQPAKRLLVDNEKNNVMIQAWEEVLKRTKILQDKSRDLYSFAGPFATRSVISSQPGAITGEAAATAQSGNQQVEIKSLATRHQVHSGSVSNAIQLPPGQFSVAAGKEERTFSFKGGNLKDLYSAIQSETNLPFEVNRTGIDAESSMLSLRSSHSGQEGALMFKDPDGILSRIGLVRQGQAGQSAQKKNAVDIASAPFVLRSSAGGTFKKTKDGLILEGAVSVALPGPLTSRDQVHIDSALKEKKFQELEIGPAITEKLGPESLQGMNLSRRSRASIATDKATTESAITVEYRHAGEKKTRQFPVTGGPQSLDLSVLGENALVEAMVFSSKEGEQIEISALEIMAREPAATGNAANESTPARDAVLKVNGVEIRRSNNEKITDIIEGVSLNLHQTTNGPVTLKIEVNADAILEKINAWIEAHNALMKFMRENSKVDVKAARELADAGNKSELPAGIFATDATIRQLSNTLRNVTSGAYPARYKPAYKILADIGITSGEVGRNFSEIQYGYLELDQEKFKESLFKSPEAVKELFAQDSNNDSRMDDGVAFKLREELDPYTRLTRGIIPGRIDLIKAGITSNKDRMARIEESVKAKEENLRARFSRMESAIGRSKATSNYLKNQMRGGGDK